MKNQADYSQYRCPYEHIEKECGHELHGTEGYQDAYGVWCACGFRGPVFVLDPEEIGLKKKEDIKELGYNTFRGDVTYISWEKCDECGLLISTRQDFKIGDVIECQECEKKYLIVEGEGRENG